MSETPATGPEKDSGQAKESAAVKAAPISAQPPPPPKKGFFQRLFDPETRGGRGLRAFVRGLAAVVGFFALGLLTGYVLLYQPLERRASRMSSDLIVTRASLEKTQAELKLAQLDLYNAERERKTASTALDRLSARLELQRAALRVMETRLGLARNDAQSARLALDSADQILSALRPALHQLSNVGTDSLDKVLELVKSDWARDAKLVDQDLQRLLSEIELIDQSLK